MRLLRPALLIALSDRVYRSLLILYPTEYRREYGGFKVQQFCDVSRDQYRQRAIIGILFWWWATSLDLAAIVSLVVDLGTVVTRIMLVSVRRRMRWPKSKASNSLLKF